MSSTAENSGGKTKKPAKATKSASDVDFAPDFALDADGVKLKVVEGGFIVKFDFNPTLIEEIRKVEGAIFDKEQQGWIVPADQTAILKQAVLTMRKEFVHDHAARVAIEQAALTAGSSLQIEHGSAATAKPMLSDYIEVGKSSTGTTGMIVAVNSRYAAQHTGFGRLDGAAFVTIHRLSALAEPVFKGDFVLITYPTDRRRGEVEQVLSKQEREQAFDDTIGNNIDGVRVLQQDGKFLVEFDFNPVLSDRMRRIEGAEFNKDSKAWSVDTDKKEFLMRAVSEMRREVLAERSDRATMQELAQTKIDGVKFKEAFTKDGTATTGRILGKNQRYLLQHTGKEFVALHRCSAFEQEPEIGQTVRIEYQAGKAKVQERGVAKQQEQHR